MPDQLSDLLIIDDNPSDVRHLLAILHMVAGYDVNIRTASTVQGALDAVVSQFPQLVFADNLSQADTAFATTLKLRGIGYEGPVVVVTGNRDPVKKQQLFAAGVVDIVDKDDLDSALLAKTLAKVRESLGPKTRH